MSGAPAAGVFDRLQAAQIALANGADGLGKPLACTPSRLARIDEERPGGLEAPARIAGMDAARTERFGAAFLGILQAPD